MILCDYNELQTIFLKLFAIRNKALLYLKYKRMINIIKLNWDAN